MKSHAPSYPSRASGNRNLNGKISATTLKMPAAFKILQQQPQDEPDPLDSLNSFSFVPSHSTGLNDTNNVSAQQRRPPETVESPVPLISFPPSSLTKHVHRAQSTPSLAMGSSQHIGKSSSSSSLTPARPDTPGKHVPFPWGLLDNRFSTASTMTTATASTDRSSSGSTMTPKPAQKNPESDSSNTNPSLHHDYQNHVSTIDIINDYADDSNEAIPVTPSTTTSTNGSTKMHKSNLNTNPTIKSKLSFLSSSSSTSNSNATPLQPPSPAPTAETPKGPGRDRYGFKKQTQFVTEAQYDEWWAGYKLHVQRRKKKWISLMKESGLSTENEQPVRFPAKSEKLKRYIRKGIPAEWRGNAWFFYAKGHEKLSSNKGLYDKLCKQVVNLKNSDTELIERDLHRTFPDNIHFRSDNEPEGGRTKENEAVLIKSLRKVLTTFSVYQPKIGYCQSLNFLAGLLLLFMDEEKAFWMLVIISQRYLPGVHEITLEGVNVDQGVLMLCVRESLPKLWQKIGVNFDGQHYNNILSKLPPITLCTAAWFMSGYIGIMPIETVLRVWDCFFFEESKTFFRIALTIFKFAEPELEGLDDPMEIFQVVQTMPKRLIDASGLLSACFKRRNGFGHISQEEIRRLREFVRERRLQANLAALRRTNDTAAASSTAVYELEEDEAVGGTGIGAGSGSADESSSTGTPTAGKLSKSTFSRVLAPKPRYLSGTSSTPYSSNDLNEYNNFKHAPRPLHVHLSRRMRSLKISRNSVLPVPTDAVPE